MGHSSLHACSSVRDCNTSVPKYMHIWQNGMPYSPGSTRCCRVLLSLYSEWTQMYADNRCMQCMEIFWNFVELFVVFRNNLDAPLSFTRLSGLYNTQWNLHTWQKRWFTFEYTKLPNASGVAKANNMFASITRNFDVWICSLSQGKFGHSRAACFEFCQF